MYTFSGVTDGRWPLGHLVLDADGNLYGATQEGGNGWGTIFEVSPTSGTWSERVLYAFTGQSDGYWPLGIITDGAGNFYGATYAGGPGGGGTVFKLDTTNAETILHGFTGAPDGSDPSFGMTLVLDPSGDLYGTTYSGSDNDLGIVFKITP